MSPAFALLALALAACPPGNGNSDGGPPPCASNSDCPPGEVCLQSGDCDNCISDAQCRPRELCDGTSRLCTLRAGWGDACQLSTECKAGEVCHQGLCKPQGEVTVCLKPEEPRACPEGQRCNRSNRVCEEDLGCFADGDCRAVEVCNPRTHQCEPRCAPETQATVCAQGFRCVESRCVACTKDDECAPGLSCDVAAGRCTTKGHCFTDRDCERPLICNRATGTCTTVPPPCTSNESCLPDQRCDVPSGRCVRRACQPDRYEPNDDLSKAAMVAPGSYPLLTLCENEADFYAAKLSRGDHLDITVEADPLLSDTMDVRILDASSRVLAVGKLAVDRVVAVNGTYYVRVTSTDRFVEYGLRIIISRGIPCDDDPFEPNEAAAQATRLPAASGPVPATGTLTVCPNDVDFFRVEVPTGTTVAVEMHYLSADGQLGLDVYDSDGTKLLGRSATGVSPERVAVSSAQVSAGYAYAVVSSVNPRVQNQYYLNLIY